MMLNKTMFIVAIGLLSAGMQLSAQDSAPLKPTDEPSVYEINFPGGSLELFANLIKKMEDQDGNKTNLVVTNSAKDFVLPTIEVTTNIEGAIGIIEACSTDSENAIVESDQSGNVRIVRVHSQDPPKMVIINVKQLLEKVDQESLLSAITVGMEMLGPSERIQLKLHKETGLFFAKGSSNTCQLVHDVIQQLEESVARSAVGFQGADESK